MRRVAIRVLVAATAIVSARATRAETPEQWVTLGTRIHGFFGAYLPVGIRIGLDALKRLDSKPGGVTVLYYSGPKSPCPCPADGIAIATVASAGQGTLKVSPQKAPDDAMGVAEIRSKATGAGFKYTVAASWLPKLDDMNKKLDALGRFNAVMNVPDLFTVEPLPPAQAQAK
jgi:FmdE, Molybdenum formylmethanofuran dehydrogenase operon